MYQKTIQFILLVESIRKRMKFKISLIDQLDRASSSVVLNIAEGNGKFSGKDRCRYFDIARGSAFECASCLDVLIVKNLISDTEMEYGKELLKEIVSMLVGLIKSNSNRVYEPTEEYRI